MPREGPGMGVRAMCSGERPRTLKRRGLNIISVDTIWTRRGCSATQMGGDAHPVSEDPGPMIKEMVLDNRISLKGGRTLLLHTVFSLGRRF